MILWVDGAHDAPENMRRDAERLAACFDYRPVPLRAPRAAMRLELDGGRVTRAELLPASRDVLPSARLCLEQALRATELPPVPGGPGPLTLELEADLPREPSSATR